MSFLSPLLWWAAPLAAAPVLIHLLFLRRARPVLFSDLTLLRAVYMRTLPSSRLRQWLLLALRCLALLLMLAAFARPVLRGGPGQLFGGGASAEQEGLRLVLLLDTSYSMGARVAGEPRIELAKKAGRELIRSLKPEDKVAVASFSDRAPSLSWALSREEALKALDAEPGWRTTDAGSAVETAYAFLAQEKGLRQGVVLLSDNAAHAFRGPVPRKSGVELMGLAWKDKPENAYVASASAQDGRPAQVLAELGSSQAGEKPLRLWLAGRLSAERTAKLPGSAAFELSSVAPGALWGWAELQEDSLPVDDRYFFSRSLKARPKVLVLSSSGDFFDPGHGGRFLKRLFSDPDGALLPYDVGFLDLHRADAETLASYRAVVLAAGAPLPAGAAAVLGGFVQGGGGLFVLLEPGLRPGGLAGLEKVLPAEPGPETALSERQVRVGDAPDAAGWKFDWGDFDVDKLEAARAYELRLNPGAKVWMKTRDARPLLAERPYGKGDSVIWASGLEPAWTNLPVKPIFTAWLNFALGQLTRSQDPVKPAQVKVGQAWQWEWPQAPEGEFWVETPERRRVQLHLRDGRVHFAGTDRPGIYWFEHGRSREPFAVNLDHSTGESDLRPLEPLPYPVLDLDKPAEALRSRFYGQEVRWAFLYGVLLLIAGETLLAGRPREG